jgi:hypothetical protein
MIPINMGRDGGFGGYGGEPTAGDDATQGAAGGFGPPGGVPPLGGPMVPGSGSDVDTTLPLILSIASTLLCCDPILGLPAIVLAIQARNAANMGAVDLARKRARTALVLAIASSGAGLILELIETLRYWGTLGVH